MKNFKAAYYFYKMKIEKVLERRVSLIADRKGFRTLKALVVFFFFCISYASGIKSW